MHIRNGLPGFLVEILTGPVMQMCPEDKGWDLKRELGILYIETLVRCPQGGLQPVANIDFPEQVVDMRLHRMGTDVESVPDVVAIQLTEAEPCLIKLPKLVALTLQLIVA